jgi:hypothetical protein
MWTADINTVLSLLSVHVAYQNTETVQGLLQDFIFNPNYSKYKTYKPADTVIISVVYVMEIVTNNILPNLSRLIAKINT